MGFDKSLAAPRSAGFLPRAQSYLSDDDEAGALRLPDANARRRPPPRSIRGAHGTYILGETLGSGATSVVRAGIHTDSLLVVAIKVLDLHRLRRHPGGVARVHSEIRILRELARRPHPHVIALRDLVRDEPKKRIYVVMEMVNGAPLQTLIQPERHGDAPEPGVRFPPSQVANIVAQTLSALAYVHGRGFVHRDVKPGNLLLSSAGVVKLSDFGVSEALDRYDEGDSVSLTSGTPAFQAPEIADGKANYSGTKVDIWALGVSAFYMLAGRLPFNARTHVELYQNIGRGEYDFPDDLKPALPPDAADAVAKMLRVDFERRPPVADLLQHPWVKAGAVEISKEEQAKRGWLSVPPKTFDVLDLAHRYMEAGTPGLASPVAGASASSSLGAPSISSSLFSPPPPADPAPPAPPQPTLASFANGLYDRPDDPILTPSSSSSSGAGVDCGGGSSSGGGGSSKLDLLDVQVVRTPPRRARAPGDALWMPSAASSASGHLANAAPASGGDGGAGDGGAGGLFARPVLEVDDGDSSDDEFMAAVACGLAAQEVSRWGGFGAPAEPGAPARALPNGHAGPEAAPDREPPRSPASAPRAPRLALEALRGLGRGPPAAEAFGGAGDAAGSHSDGVSDDELFASLREHEPERWEFGSPAAAPGDAPQGPPARAPPADALSPGGPLEERLPALRDAGLELRPVPGAVYDNSRTYDVASPVWYPEPRREMALPGAAPDAPAAHGAPPPVRRVLSATSDDDARPALAAAAKAAAAIPGAPPPPPPPPSGAAAPGGADPPASPVSPVKRGSAAAAGQGGQERGGSQERHGMCAIV